MSGNLSGPISHWAGMTLTIDKAPAMPAVIRRLVAADAQDYRTIRLAALARDPDAFGSVYDIEVARPLSAFAERLASAAVFGAFPGERLVGTADLKIESGPIDRHQAPRVGRGLYARLFFAGAHRSSMHRMSLRPACVALRPGRSLPAAQSAWDNT